MAMSGKAAMVLYYDIAEAEVAAHDDWHSHEHFRERLQVPGFLRASRWVSLTGGARYLVLYEVAELEVLVSAPYLQRLGNPTPWTTKTMAHFRGMMRGFARLSASAGAGLGQALASVRCLPRAGRADELRGWLASEALPGLAARPGMAGAHLLEPGLAPPMTAEQRMRGKDADLPWVVLATGYDAGEVERAASALAPQLLERHGAEPGATAGRYRLDLTATERECAA